MTTGQQTALDEFVELVVSTRLALVGIFGEDDETSTICIDGAVGAMLTVEPELLSRALQDPRFIAYCEEQDAIDRHAGTSKPGSIVAHEDIHFWRNPAGYDILSI